MPEVKELAEKLENLPVVTVAISDPSGETNAIYFVLTRESAEALARVALEFCEERKWRRGAEVMQAAKRKTNDVKVPTLGGISWPWRRIKKEPK